MNSRIVVQSLQEVQSPFNNFTREIPEPDALAAYF
jgi:hypothetical protein